MKYDLTKCNNLNFRRGYNTGFLKVNEGKAYMYSYKKEWAVAIGAERHFYFGCAQLDELASEEDFEIIPRNTEKYEAWKVGDKVVNIKHGDVYTIAALVGNAAVLTMDAGDYTALTKTDALTKYYKLVLTDYEQELLNAKGQDVCPFKNGDRVLVRDENEGTWVFETFDSYEGGNEYPYDCEFDCYRQCIPYNEKTWKLLGTTDEYKEEE